MSTRRLTLTTLVALCGLILGVLTWSATAGAEITHKYLFQISEVPATGSHGEPVASPGRLKLPKAMTVDGGELYVGEGFEPSRLDKFDASSGAFISQFAEAPSPAYDFKQAVAVGHSTGEAQVYDVGDRQGETHEGIVAVFGAAGDFQAEWSGADTPSKAFGCFECNGTGGVAVDNSGNVGDWAAGDVFVADPEHKVVDVFVPSPKGAEKYVTQLDGIEQGVPFNRPTAVAVNQLNGDLLVLDENAVDVFEPGVLERYALVGRVEGTQARPLQQVEGLAVDSGAGEGSGDIYLLEGATSTVLQFSATGAFLGRLTGSPEGSFGVADEAHGYGQLVGIAVDPASHDVFVGTYNTIFEGKVDVFGPDVAIPDVSTEPASAVKPESAQLNGIVNPQGGSATCHFLWGTGEVLTKVAPCEPETVEGEAAVAVHAELRGIQPDTTYTYRLQASNANGTNPGEANQNQHFQTPGPGIGESVSDIASSSATLEATIDPDNAPTTYYFQYGTSSSYGSETPAPPGALVGSAKGSVELSKHVQGLLASTLYHYRAVAVSELEAGVVQTFFGPDQTFSTQPTGASFGLPDNRQWEMVSPPHKEGALIRTDIGSLTQASATGEAMAYVASWIPTEAEPEGATPDVQVLARRTREGWVSQDITVPHHEAAGFVGSSEDAFLSEDLSLGVMQPRGSFEALLSEEASEQTPYLRTMFVNHDVNDPCLPTASGALASSTKHCYRPLVSGCPATGECKPAVSEHADVPRGTTFGQEEECSEKFETAECGPSFAGATPDLRHILLTSRVPLTLDPAMPGQENLYEWENGKLTFVGTALANGEALPRLGGHAISEDGSRVVFLGEVEGQVGLFMRDIATGDTLQLDAVQGGTGANASVARFEYASSDGSRVFFSDTQMLTGDAGTLVEGADASLYECDIVEEAGKLHCRLTDLTPVGPRDEFPHGEAVLGASEDGSFVYFVARGALTQDADECERTCANLYVRDDGTTKLIAVLASNDLPDWKASGPRETARVSADGHWLTFMSQQDLVGYSTLDARNGVPDEEVYLYNATSGRLACASCNPTGARPIGTEFKLGTLISEGVGSDQEWSPDQRFAATITPWSENTPARANLYQTRYLSSDGRLFFNSRDALVPQDVNGTWDVYEYEPVGVGSCGNGSAGFSQSSDGCVSLISSGTSAEESVFLDASQGGGDVFFLTAAELAPQDFDTALDIYDARECTETSQCFPPAAVQPPACSTGDACKPAPTPQPTLFGVPSSATFSGAGNIVPDAPVQKSKPRSSTRVRRLSKALKSCKRQPKRRRKQCEKKARARYAAKRSRNAQPNKGGRG